MRRVLQSNEIGMKGDPGQSSDGGESTLVPDTALALPCTHGSGRTQRTRSHDRRRQQAPFVKCMRRNSHRPLAPSRVEPRSRFSSAKFSVVLPAPSLPCPSSTSISPAGRTRLPLPRCTVPEGRRMCTQRYGELPATLFRKGTNPPAASAAVKVKFAASPDNSRKQEGTAGPADLSQRLSVG